MAVDWIGFSYAAAIAFGGFMGYKRKGSVMSLMAGLVFGGLSAYGAYNISNDPKDIKILLVSSGLLSIVMGMRYKKSRKLLPAGVMAGESLVIRVLHRGMMSAIMCCVHSLCGLHLYEGVRTYTALRY
uniref:Uncharacterized protein n=1 Tax=Periophthalmus magnuspinnatus TaxID=409849 RepID=A0A3B4BJU3_9GOBI